MGHTRLRRSRHPPRPQHPGRRRPAHHGLGPARSRRHRHRHPRPRTQDRRRTRPAHQPPHRRRPPAGRLHARGRTAARHHHLRTRQRHRRRRTAHARRRGQRPVRQPRRRIEDGLWRPPLTGRALAAGLRPALSIDVVPSVGGDMFSTMRTAFSAQRGLDGGLRARDLVHFATIDAARSCGLEARTGSITPGKDADIILLRTDDVTVFPVTDPIGTIVTAGHPGIVDTVLVVGRIVKRDGALVDIDLTPLQSRLLASRDRIAAAAGVALDGTWHPKA
ncbi:amidohydrolase family protein [Streptomyces sp. NPDC058985]|uniref:amidohydrolase family protein n=1 Tax=Streptomyces sp. NPDC058985 TaxID=3346684 RepID=UPI0036C3C02D